jgi:DNA adenine methylase
VRENIKRSDSDHAPKTDRCLSRNSTEIMAHVRSHSDRLKTRSALEKFEHRRHSKDSSKESLSPFVKWAGGKTSLLAQLMPHVPLNLSDYYEPFLGGGALFLRICMRTTGFTSHLSDTNEELISAYRVIKESPEKLILHLSRLQTEYDSASDKSAYFYRKRDWRSDDPIESAARLVFLNKTCYNGLYRVNSKGEFNVPFGRYKNPRILNSSGIKAISQALKITKAELRSVDYHDALATCRKSDVVYLDPPYQPPSKTSNFTDYTSGGFSEKNQEELAEEFGRLVDRGCVALLSNSDTALTRYLYRDFEMKKVTVNRPINSVGTGRKGYRELIVLGHRW